MPIPCSKISEGLIFKSRDIYKTIIENFQKSKKPEGGFFESHPIIPARHQVGGLSPRSTDRDTSSSHNILFDPESEWDHFQANS